MTLDAYAKNVAIDGQILLDSPKANSSEKDDDSDEKLISHKEKIQKSSNLHLINDKKIACNALYIRIPSLK